MCQENARVSGVALNTLEIVDITKYIVGASLSSTRCRTDCGVGGGERRNVFNKIARV